MTDDSSIETAIKALSVDEQGRRREAATRLAVAARKRPGSVSDHVSKVLRNLDTTDKKLRRELSNVLYHVAVEDATAVKPITRQLFQYLDDCDATVRVHVSRAIGEVAAHEPARIRVGVDALLDCLDDEEDQARHSMAWALEKLAFRYPDELLGSFDTVVTLVTDDHPPVAKHGCRAVAYLHRRGSVATGETVERLDERLRSDDDDLAAAACIALGAIGTDRSIATLRDGLEGMAPEPVVRAARHALRETRYPLVADTDGEQLSPPYHESPPSTGTWLTLNVIGFTPQTGRFRGFVTSSDPRSVVTVDTPAESVDIRLENPFEGYELALSLEDRTISGSYENCRQSDRMNFDASDLRYLEAERIPLLYATEGDRLSFAVERSEYETEVVAVDDVDGVRVVSCADLRRGHELEFRPLSREPLTARFRKGRGFKATDVTLTSPEGLSADSTEN